MYEPHESLKPPKSGRLKIWRYMGFSKYIALLETKCLYFSRADQLGEPYEASVPEGMVKNLDKRIRKVRDIGTGESIQRAKEMEENLASFQWIAAAASLSMYVNCWHMSMHESDAMWRVYLKGSDGVAIQSTPTRLKESIAEAKERISIGKVIYQDYEKADLHDEHGHLNIVDFVTHKRMCFKHESELRAVIWKPPQDGHIWDDNPLGLHVPVDLHQLVKVIYVSPDSPPWVEALIRNVNKRYGIVAEVLKSQLASKPKQFVYAQNAELEQGEGKAKKNAS